MQFFNFTNDETFHFFKWITESEQVDPNALIDEAYIKVETDKDHFEGEDICIVARDILADQLRDLLDDALEPLPLPFWDETLSNVENSKESLWHALLAFAAERINCRVTAEALLVWAHKWAPDKHCPEA
jgi:hypothetical protein